MSQALAVNVKQLVVTHGSFGPQEIHQIVDSLADDGTNHRNLREAVNELEVSEDRSPAAAVRLGVCQYILGRYHQAIDTLKTGDGGALAHFYLGRAYAALEQYDKAQESFAAAAKAGYDADACALARTEVLRVSGNPQGALEALDQLHGAVEQTAEYLYRAAG